MTTQFICHIVERLYYRDMDNYPTSVIDNTWVVATNTLDEMWGKLLQYKKINDSKQNPYRYYEYEFSDVLEIELKSTIPSSMLTDLANSLGC